MSDFQCQWVKRVGVVLKQFDETYPSTSPPDRDFPCCSDLRAGRATPRAFDGPWVRLKAASAVTNGLGWATAGGAEQCRAAPGGWPPLAERLMTAAVVTSSV